MFAPDQESTKFFFSIVHELRNRYFQSTYLSTIASGQILAPSRTYTRKNIIVQIAVAALLCAAIGMYFWVDSRYPALLKKLHSGKNIHVTGAPRLPRTPLSPQSEQWLAWGQHWCRRQFR